MHDFRHGDGIDITVDLGKLLTGEIDRNALSDTDRYNFLTKHYKPTKSSCLPFQTIIISGVEKKRYFHIEWLNEFEWLVFSPACRGGLCKYCVLYGEISKGVLGQLVKEPFTNFKKLKVKKDFSRLMRLSIIIYRRR